MELTLASLHKGQVPWKGLLLAASLLTYWISLATAQVIVEVNPLKVEEGENVYLQIPNLPSEAQVTYWYKGNKDNAESEIARFINSSSKSIPGPLNSGREKVYQNGSLLLQKVTKKDAGTYTVHLLLKSFDTLTGTVNLKVNAPLSNITSNNSNAMEGEDSVTLMSEPKTKKTTYLWRINGQRLSEDDRLKLSEDAMAKPTIQIFNTTVKEYEAVNITCVTDDPKNSIRWHFNGHVLQLPDRMMLYQNGGILSIQSVREEDSGLYECEVFNSAVSKKSDPIQLDVIPDPQKNHFRLSASAIASIAIESLAGLILLAALVYFLCFRKTGRGTDQRNLTEHKPSASNHSKHQKMKRGLSSRVITGIVGQCLLALIGLIILLIFLSTKSIRRGRKPNEEEGENQMKEEKIEDMAGKVDTGPAKGKKEKKDAKGKKKDAKGKKKDAKGKKKDAKGKKGKK